MISRWHVGKPSQDALCTGANWLSHVFSMNVPWCSWSTGVLQFLVKPHFSHADGVGCVGIGVGSFLPTPRKLHIIQLIYVYNIYNYIIIYIDIIKIDIIIYYHISYMINIVITLHMKPSAKYVRIHPFHIFPPYPHQLMRSGGGVQASVTP